MSWVNKERKQKFAEAVLQTRAANNLSDNCLIRYLQREGKLSIKEAREAVSKKKG